MKQFDEVYDSVSGAASIIDEATHDLVFDEDQVPYALRTRLLEIQLEIDRLARLATQRVEEYEGEFGPTETWFHMPATIAVHWNREEKRMISAEVMVDRGWSPSTVTDEDDNTITSDDRQCTAWRAALENDISGYQLA
jgi:hypothetical protein